MSTDMRVLNNLGLGGSNQIGLTGFGPNINIVKDPRYVYISLSLSLVSA